MKITIFFIGLLVAVIAIIIDAQDGIRVASIGYFLLSSAMMISAAIWRPDIISDNHYRAIQKVYSALAEGGLDMDTLLKRMVGNNTDMGTSEFYQATIGRMLSKRQIIIQDGLVTIGDGIDTTS